MIESYLISRNSISSRVSVKTVEIRITMTGTGKMVQWLSALDTLSEDEGLTLSIQGGQSHYHL